MSAPWIAPHPHPTCSVPGIDRPLIRHSDGCAFRVRINGEIEGYYQQSMEAHAVAKQLNGVVEQRGHWTHNEWRTL